MLGKVSILHYTIILLMVDSDRFGIILYIVKECYCFLKGKFLSHDSQTCLKCQQCPPCLWKPDHDILFIFSLFRDYKMFIIVISRRNLYHTTLKPG